MSNARNLANLLGNGTTIATASIADDAITAAKIDDDGTGFTFGDLTVAGAVVGDGFTAKDKLKLDGSSVATVTVNSAVSASATIVVDGVAGTIVVGMVVNVSDTTIRSITDAASQSAISTDDTLTITAVASQTSFTVSEAVTIPDNVVLILISDESGGFVLDSSASGTDVGEEILFEDGTSNVVATGSIIQVHTEITTASLSNVTLAGQNTQILATSGSLWHTCASFTPKFPNSKILFQTSTISAHESVNTGDGHFALVTDDTTLFARTGSFVSYQVWDGNLNASFIAFNHSFDSWGTSAKQLKIKFGGQQTGARANQYVNIPSSENYSHATTRVIGITIMEIGG